jgi:hypothetical protein
MNHRPIPDTQAEGLPGEPGSPEGGGMSGYSVSTTFLVMRAPGPSSVQT